MSAKIYPNFDVLYVCVVQDNYLLQQAALPGLPSYDDLFGPDALASYDDLFGTEDLESGSVNLPKYQDLFGPSATQEDEDL